VLTLAIQPDDQPLMSGRRQSFSRRWTELARSAECEVRVVDVYQRNLPAQFAGCNGFLWWFAHLPHTRESALRIVQAVGHGLGMQTFPNWRTVWHFDDKVAQAYLLDAAGIPTPNTFVFWKKARALAFARDAQYPLVLKLAGGIGSEHVGKITSSQEAIFWIEQLFGPGVISLTGWPLPSAARRAKTRLRAAAKALAGRQPWPMSDRTAIQRGYVLFQEFMSGNDFDTRVTVIGDRAFAFRRFNRPDDFRASGSGKIDWDPAPIDPRAVALAFRVAGHLGTQSLAVDVLKGAGDRLVVNEISYYYEGWAVEACPGHWTPDLSWVSGHVAPEDAIFDDFVTIFSLAA
jgi:glutathione synthase/RimK-type ligase-like ATP-grasp enzyme